MWSRIFFQLPGRAHQAHRSMESTETLVLEHEVGVWVFERLID